MRNISLKTRLILAFIFISIIPVIAIVWIGYYNSSNIIRKNAEEAALSNVTHTGVSLDVWLESYEDILFQIYTNDEIVAMIDTINRNDADLTVTQGQLRRTLRGLFYTKEHIKSITIITESGNVVFYDLLTGSMTKNSWLDNLGMSQNELYEAISEDNVTHVISTQFAGVYASEPYYLFHLAHRIIDYKKVDKRLGIVIVSIDEKMLQEICGYNQDANEITFLVDKEGYLVSFPEKEWVGQSIIERTIEENEKNEQYLKFIKERKLFSGEHITVNSIYDEKFGYDIVHVSNQNTMMSSLSNQKNVMMLILAVSMILLIALILILTHSLTASLQMLVGKMKRAEKGELTVRVDMEARMLPEVETIANQFNRMLGEVSLSMEREKAALEKQKNAEIETLEAQINPHFLYNTLDTINWMAIDKDEYEISNSITALAAILRYGIDKSNSIVTIQKECEWLKQYLFLQQTRLKNRFVCDMHVSPEVLECSIHKLLLQPFVENSILHGFEGNQEIQRLEISITPEGEMLHIEIYDNGKGMPREVVERMNQGIFPKTKDKNHIGMENACNRIRMYYPDNANVKIESEEGTYTKIHIMIPMRKNK